MPVLLHACGATAVNADVDYLDNAESAEFLGWNATWLELPPDLEVSDDLVADAVADQQAWYGQPITGVLDSVTWSRIEFMRTLELQADLVATVPSDHVWVGGVSEPVPFAVVTWEEPGGLGIKKFWTHKGKKRTRYASRKGSEINRVVFHWTGTKTPHHTFRAAWNTKRSVSTHFEIGDDGTIHQLVDLAEATYNSGKGWLNRCCIGVDLTLNPARRNRHTVNAALVRLGLRSRPITTGIVVRGWDPGPFLGATPEQLVSLRELMRWFRDRFGIPMTSPDAPVRPFVVAAICGIKDATPDKLPPGWLHHAHFKAGRWDTACVSLPQQFELARAA